MTDAARTVCDRGDYGPPVELTTFFRRHSPARMASAEAAGERADDMFAASERLFAPDGGRVDDEAPYVVVTARARPPRPGVGKAS